jgi:hypothetical protein
MSIDQTSPLALKAYQWFGRGMTTQQMEAELVKEGIDERHVAEMLRELKKLYYAKRTSQGLVLILIGAIICLTSCIVTFFSSYSSMSLALYGLTSIGVVIVFAGLMKIFG